MIPKTGYEGAQDCEKSAFQVAQHAFQPPPVIFRKNRRRLWCVCAGSIAIIDWLCERLLLPAIHFPRGSLESLAAAQKREQEKAPVVPSTSFHFHIT